jgi:hypothetical protein
MVLIMKKIATQILLSAVLVFGSVGITQAQKSKIRYADQQMELMNYKTASELYQQAYANKPQAATARKVAASYDVILDYENAYTWWKTVISYEEATLEDYGDLLRTAEFTDNLNEAKRMLEAKGYTAANSAAVKTLMMSRPRIRSAKGKTGADDCIELGRIRLHVYQRCERECVLHFRPRR